MAATVVHADDHPVARAGLRGWLPPEEFEIVGEASGGAEAETLARELRPAVLLSEIRLSGRDGLECLRRLRESGDTTPVLFYTAHENPTYYARAIALQSAGLLLKSSDRDALLESLRRAAAGQSCWTNTDLRRYGGSVAESSKSSPPNASVTLTTRERDVLKQLGFGLSNKEIAASLGISYETVKEHVHHILRKLGVSDRTQAAVWAVRQGFA